MDKKTVNDMAIDKKGKKEAEQWKITFESSSLDETGGSQSSDAGKVGGEQSNDGSRGTTEAKHLFCSPPV